MFKKVRRNFIIVAMSSITLVLLIVNVVINITNLNRQVNDSDTILNVIESTLRPEPMSNDAPDPRIGDSRYFVVEYNKTNNEYKYNLMHIETSIISETTAKNYTVEVLKQNSKKGYYNVYRYHVSEPSTSVTRVVFLDCQRSMQNTRNFIMITLYTSLGALGVCFIIIFFTSKAVIKPIKESYEKQNRFISNASHELKTPLAVISTNNELLEMKKGKNQYSSNIQKQINRLNIMIKDLSTLSKINESMNPKYESIDLNNLLKDPLNNLKELCDKENIKLTKHICKASIIADKIYVSHIVSIILDNARKYCKSKINVSLYKEKNSYIFKQTNDCQSIEDGDLMKYAERFYRHENTRTKIEGSGIGLSLLEELVNKINAKVKIYGKDNTYNIEIIFSNKNKIK